MDQITIIDYDPKYLDQHIEIRDNVLEKVKFRTKDLMMAKEELEQTYAGKIYQSCNLIRYAVKGEELLGFVTCAMDNSLLLNIQVDGMEASATLAYPMVRDNNLEVLQLLIEDVKQQMQLSNFEKVICHIATGHQQAEQIIEQYFEFDKAMMQFGLAEVDTRYDLPDTDDLQPLPVDRHDDLKPLLLQAFEGVPKPVVQGALDKIAGRPDCPSVAIMDGDQIKAWLAALPSEQQERKADIMIPYLPQDDDYPMYCLTLVAGLIDGLREVEEVDELIIPPVFRPDVIEQLKEAGIPFTTEMASYVLKLED